uniref:activity-dependent neuroprotector homeobox protein-like n=1 Tax=Doryrhamphus excisus TaxID=161450 RepID=UPI0025ADC9B6|nr:activity-dependent neuroprotector homeobox protein-like [Doryrhamphus excisus]
MYQVPVTDVTTLRKARTKVKIALEDIGLEYCKEVVKDFCSDEELSNDMPHTDVCLWHPAYSKIQGYRSRPFWCGVCHFSSRSYPSYQNHFRNAHKKSIQNRLLLKCSYCVFIGKKSTLDIHVRIFHKDKLEQQQAARIAATRQRQLQPKRAANGAVRPMYYCKKCMYRDTLYNGVRRHIYREHFKHVATPYLGMVSKSSVQNGAPFNGDNILCKRCRFTTKSYESLVQHVIEYHERIGAQVTTMIGHSNVTVSSLPSMSQKSSMVVNGGSPMVVNPKSQVIGYLKPAAPVFKNQSVVAAKEDPVPTTKSTADESSGPVVNTGKTQKWKICTVCNELFPENLYSAHFESAHKARRVWALAKYIMKIHNFTSKCLLCNRYLPSDTLLNHMLIHGITCPQCHSAFHSVEKLLDHERQVHLEAYVGPPGASPLTFDLTIKQNIQLHILTFNMKKADGQDHSVGGLNMGSPHGKATPSTFSELSNQSPDMFYTVMEANEIERPMCPLCCAILKDPAPDALVIHLRQRHQVLQTMHPVEKRLTYKCIHCLGVYTSNMVASTITLHLVQCRGVGRNHGMQGPKAALPLHSSGVNIIKKQLPTRAVTHPRKVKMAHAGQDGLALKPKINENKTYEARKNFLKAYFNQKPYLSPKEEKKLSASLWVWKADICKHFETMQNACKRQCEASNASVLLGFDMQALKKVKHDIVFENIQRDGTSEARPGGLKSGTPNMTQNSTKLLPQSMPPARRIVCNEPILIDSDSDPETEPILVANTNGDPDQLKIQSRKPAKSTKTELMSVDNTNNQSALQVTESQQPESTETEPMPVDDTDDSDLEKTESRQPESAEPVPVDDTDDSDLEKTESRQPESTETEPVPVDDTDDTDDSDLEKTESRKPESTETELVPVDDTDDSDLEKTESQQAESKETEPVPVDDTDDSDLEKTESQQPESKETEPVPVDDTDDDSDLEKTESQQPAESGEIESMPLANSNDGSDPQKTEPQQPVEITETEPMLVDDTDGDPDLQKTGSQQPAESTEKVAHVSTFEPLNADEESLQDGLREA